MRTVLILEDDTSTMKALRGLLRSWSFLVLGASTGKEALEMGSQSSEPIDLFISDMGLPDMSGTEVALGLCRTHPALPILFISGTPMYGWNRADMNNFRRLPASRVDFLEKPFGRGELLDKIGHLLTFSPRLSTGWA